MTLTHGGEPLAVDTGRTKNERAVELACGCKPLPVVAA